MIDVKATNSKDTNALDAPKLGWHNLAGYKRLYILGAGFSAPADMPLTNQLLPLVFQRAAEIKTVDDSSELGHAQILLDSLKFYCPDMEFDPEALLDSKEPSGFNFEKFLTYMGVNSAAQMGTGEQLDEHGSQELSYFKYWTAEVIRHRQALAVLDGLPTVYREFAGTLENAMVFTFNWDTILETLLHEANVEYQLDRHSCCKPPAIPVLKLHGSIDWFSTKHCLRKPWMRLRPIGKSLPKLSRATEPISELTRYYDAGMTPWIVLPSFDKVYQVMRYDELWQMLYLYLQNELEVNIIGFSLRPDDYHTHAIIYPQLVDGARKGRIKLRVVDLAQSSDEKMEIKNRFSHIPNCEFWFEGFNEDCLEFLSS